MDLKTATNRETGERLYYDDEADSWSPLTTATNPKTGERVYLRGDMWKPYNPAGKSLGTVTTEPSDPRVSDRVSHIERVEALRTGEAARAAETPPGMRAPANVPGGPKPDDYVAPEPKPPSVPLPPDESTIGGHWDAGMVMLDMVLPGIGLFSGAQRANEAYKPSPVLAMQQKADAAETAAKQWRERGNEKRAAEWDLKARQHRAAAARFLDRARKQGRESIGYNAAELARLSKKLERFKNNPAAERMLGADTFAEAIDAFSLDPWGALVSIVVRSAPISGPAVAGGVAGGIAGGPGGAAAGAFGGGFTTEFGIDVGQKIIEAARSGKKPDDAQETPVPIDPTWSLPTSTR